MKVFMFVGYATASSLLLQGATIVGWNEEQASLEVTRNGSLLITNDRIVDIYASGKKPGNLPEKTEVIDAAGKILTPGFVDTHRHNWQTILRGMKSQHAIWDHFVNSMNPEGLITLTPEDIYNSQLLSIYEGLNAGVTTQLDHSHHPPGKSMGEAALQASIDSGGRIFHAYSIGNNGFNNSLKEFADQFRQVSASFETALNESSVSLGIACDAFSSASQEELELVAALFRDYDIPVLTTHMLYGPYGIKNSPELLHRLGFLNISTPVIISHGSFLDHSDYELLKSTNQYVSVAIESEMSYGQTNPTAHLWLDQSSLGIDGSFSFSGDLLTQTRILIQFIRHLFFTKVLDRWRIPANAAMTNAQAFLLATRNGGLSLRRPDIGIIAAGAKADVLVWDSSSLPMLGWTDPISAVLMHGNVADIQDVIVNGVFKKRNGKLLVPDLEQVRQNFLESAGRFQSDVLALPKVKPGNGVKWISGAEVEEVPLVDVSHGKGDGNSLIES